MAGAFAEIARQTLMGEFRRINPQDARILLIEGGPRVLQAMPEILSAKALTQLQQLGVEVRLNAIVTSIDAQGLKVRGPAPAGVLGSVDYTIASKCVVWAAGVAASPLGANIAQNTGCSAYTRGSQNHCPQTCCKQIGCQQVSCQPCEAFEGQKSQSGA
jgi:NADH dehydrogenase